MTRHIITIILLLTLYACNNINRQKGDFERISNEYSLKELSNNKQTTEQILDKITPSVLAFAKADTSDFYYGDNIIEDDSIFRKLLVGKTVNKTTILATEINIKDTVINFYMLDNKTWKLIGSEKTNIPIYKLEFEDLDGDNYKEIITSTSRNMNGNTWHEIYYFSDKAKTIKYAGSFSTDYIVKKDKKQIEETYEGSWYMDNSKTLYEWRQEKLVPLKQIIIAHEQPVSQNGKLSFEYYENSTNDINGLKLKYKEPYSDDNKKQQQLWDNFFTGQ